MNLEQRIKETISAYRLTYGVSSLFALGFAAQDGYIYFALTLAILVAGYNLGFWLIGQYYIHTLSDADAKAMNLESAREELQRRLEAGDIGGDELDELLVKAGYETLPKILDVGPVIAHQFDQEIHDWIDAKRSNQPTKRYYFLEAARLDEYHVIQNKVTAGNEYLVYNDMLYETKPEPQN